MMVGAGTMSYFDDTEVATGNTFTAGTIDIRIDPTEGQVVTTPCGLEDLKPCQTGYITERVKNVGENPCHLWKHIKNVVNDENEIVEPEQEYYDNYKELHPDSTPENWKISNWIHYDLAKCKILSLLELSVLDGVAEYDDFEVYVDGILVYEYDAQGGNPEDWIEHSIQLADYGIPCFGTHTVEVKCTADTAWEGHDTYGQLAVDYAKLYCEGEIPCDKVDVGDETSESGHNLVGWGPIEPANSGGNYGGITNCRVTWEPGEAGNNEARGATLELTCSDCCDIIIHEDAGWYLTDSDGDKGVECKWIYLGVLEPGQIIVIRQSYHLDKDVENWGQSDLVTFDMEFLAQQTVGDPGPNAPTPNINWPD